MSLGYACGELPWLPLCGGKPVHSGWWNCSSAQHPAGINRPGVEESSHPSCVAAAASSTTTTLNLTCHYVGCACACLAIRGQRSLLYHRMWRLNSCPWVYLGSTFNHWAMSVFLSALIVDVCVNKCLSFYSFSDVSNWPGTVLSWLSLGYCHNSRKIN